MGYVIGDVKVLVKLTPKLWTGESGIFLSCSQRPTSIISV